jgi:hypothetical protein
MLILPQVNGKGKKELRRSGGRTVIFTIPGIDSQSTFSTKMDKKLTKNCNERQDG